MAHGNLFYPPVLQLYQCRQETMHPGKERNPFRIIGAQHFQRASGILHPVMRHHSAEPVGDTGRHIFDETVFPSGTDAHHHLELVRVFQQAIKILGCRLQIGIDVSHPLGKRIVYPRFHGSTQSPVFSEIQKEKSLVSTANLPDKAFTIIFRAVVYKQYTRSSLGCL